MKNLLFILFSMLPLVHAGDSEQASFIRKEITERVESIVKVYDESARVDVSISLRQNTQPKPVQGAFLISRLTENNEKFSISKGNVTIYSRLENDLYPNALKENIKSVLKEYSSNIAVKYEQIPVEQLGFFQYFYKNRSTLIFYLPLALIALLVFIYAQIGGKGSRGQDLTTTIKESVDVLKTSLDNLSFQQLSQAQNNGFAAVSQPLNFEFSNGNDSYMKDFDVNSIQELLMDCYWCQEDEYAAFVWSKLDLTKKSQLLSREARVGEYANYISHLTPVDKKFINETYYFSPFALSSIPNVQLTKLVLKYKSVFHLLPKLRLACLGIDANEKKKLLLQKFTKAETERELLSVKWDEFASTESRSFNSNLSFTFSSDQEEEEFFEDPLIDLSLADSFPSLGWLLKLREEEAETILQKYSANELAQAWCGPRSILNILENRLPTKKKETMLSYLENLKPSKESPVFLRIFDETTQKLNSYIEVRNNSLINLKAS